MIYLIDIEAIPNRYSEQWREWIPKLFNHETTTISGTDYSGLSSGGFFDFTSTNIYKSEQVIKLGQLIKNGDVKDGDVFYFYDIWHPGVINLKYMLDLAGIDAKICGMLHAGSYDETDILGIHDLGRWADGFEESIFKAADAVFVASVYHAGLVTAKRDVDCDKIIIAEWPYDFSLMDSLPDVERENLVIFPHRLSPDKNPDLFDELAQYFPNYTFMKLLEHDFTKEEYHKILKHAKIIFSAATHENLGLATMEAAYSGAIPVLPDRCVYPELYDELFLYPKDAAVHEIIHLIQDVINNYDSYARQLKDNIQYLKETKFSFELIRETIEDWNSES